MRLFLIILTLLLAFSCDDELLLEDTIQKQKLLHLEESESGIFEAIFFLDNDLVNYSKELTRLRPDEENTDGLFRDDIKTIILDRIKDRDPLFFKQFQTEITSGDPSRVGVAVGAGSWLISNVYFNHVLTETIDLIPFEWLNEAKNLGYVDESNVIVNKVEYLNFVFRQQFEIYKSEISSFDLNSGKGDVGESTTVTFAVWWAVVLAQDIAVVVSVDVAVAHLVYFVSEFWGPSIDEAFEPSWAFDWDFATVFDAFANVLQNALDLITNLRTDRIIDNKIGGGSIDEEFRMDQHEGTPSIRRPNLSLELNAEVLIADITKSFYTK